jgi:hypothetical protein
MGSVPGLLARMFHVIGDVITTPPKDIIIHIVVISLVVLHIFWKVALKYICYTVFFLFIFPVALLGYDVAPAERVLDQVAQWSPFPYVARVFYDLVQDEPPLACRYSNHWICQQYGKP